VHASRILIPMVGFGRTGGYRVLSELASAWTRSGREVDFLVPAELSCPYFPTSAGIVIVDAAGSVSRRQRGPADAGHQQAPGARDIYWRLLRGLRQIGAGYDVILANQSLTTFPVLIADCGTARKFYYVQAYEPDYYAVRSGWKSRLLRGLSLISYALPLRQIANAPIYIGHKGIRATSWIAPGIDPATFFRRVRPPAPGAAGRWTIGTIGRRERDKGTVFVQRAFELLAGREPDVHLKIAFNTASELWHHERAQIVTPASDRELAEFYRSVDVLVAVPTQQFGACHYPVLEAMACGTPVVSTGHLPADRSNAWIVPPGDAAAIASAVLEVRATSAAELALKIDRAAAATAAFTWDKVAGDFLQLLEQEGD
jgi:glycosyltransferase involved in cell wall biosynthesis